MLSSGTKEGEAGAVGCRGHQLLLSQQLLLSWVASLVPGRPLLATPGLVMTRRSPRPPPPRLLFSGSDPTCQGCSWTRLVLRSVPGSPGGSLLWDRVPLSQSQSLGAEKRPPTPSSPFPTTLLCKPSVRGRAAPASCRPPIPPGLKVQALRGPVVRTAGGTPWYTWAGVHPQVCLHGSARQPPSALSERPLE